MVSYWSKTLSRRRVLRLSAATLGGVTSLSLIGCGGGKDEGKPAASGLVAPPVETTAKATRGGLFEMYVDAEPPNFDAATATSVYVSTAAAFAYPNLVRNKMVKYPKFYDGDVEADAATSWEVSPDGLQYTFKMRPNNKLDPRPPTNNRPLDANDVKWSWEAFAQKSVARTLLSHSAAPTAPIEGVTAADNSTAVVKLAFPYAALLPMVAFNRHLPLMPREAATFDTRSELLGSGAWRLASRTPSVGYEFRKNPDWFDADKVYLDGIKFHIVTEYANGVAQLRAGNLWTYNVKAEDIIQIKRDVPELALMEDEGFSRSINPWMAFGALPGSPFKDERVRQAVSMLIDRNIWMDVQFNTERFRKEGITVETRVNSQVASGDEAFWVDPRGKQIGPGGKNFGFDPAEAKKLIQAAGKTLPLELPFNYVATYPANYQRQVQVLMGMLQEGGNFKLKANPVDYPNPWFNNYHLGNGRYEGFVLGQGNTYPEIDGHLSAYFHSASDMVWSGEKDPKSDDLIERQRKELDRTKRTALIQEWQRLTAQTIPSLIAPGSARQFRLVWPFAANYGLWRGAANGQQAYSYLWYDSSSKKEGKTN